MPNRFYRPTPTQYTSQFVAEQYPYDAMLALEDQKIQRAEGVIEQTGKLDAMASAIRGGYRTADIAPQIRDEWRENIGEFLDENRDLSSPDTLRGLSSLRARFLGDPNVQLIQQDFLSGNKEWDQLRKSKTFNLDYNPNLMDPKDARSSLRQFQRDEQYRPYDPLTYYSDFEGEIDRQLAQVPIQSTPLKPTWSVVVDPVTGIKERVMTQGSKDFRGEETFRDPINEMAEDILEGTSEYANYMKTKIGDKVPWTEGGIKDYLRGRSTRYFVNKDRQNISSRGLTKAESDLMTGVGPVPERSTRPHARAKEQGTIDIEDPKFFKNLGARVQNAFVGIQESMFPEHMTSNIKERKPIEEIKQDRSFDNVAAKMILDNPELDPNDDKAMRNAVKDYQKEYLGKGEVDVFTEFSPKERQEYHRLYGGEETEDGYIIHTTAPAILTDAKVVDLTDPKKNEVEDKERSKFMSEGNTFTMKGPLTPTKNDAGPGYIYFTVADKKGRSHDYAVSPDNLTRDRYRLPWNLSAWARNSSFNTQSHDEIEKVESFRWYGRMGDGTPMIQDRENKNEVNYTGGYFTIVPRRDFRGYDDFGEKAMPGRYVIDVYARDPKGKEPVSTYSVNPDVYYDEDQQATTPMKEAWASFEAAYPELAKQYLKKSNE